MSNTEFLLLIWRSLRTLLKWLLIAIFGVLLLCTSVYGLYKIFSMWTYEADLMEHDKPYGGGDMRIHGRQVMVFKPIGPEIKFKDMTEEEIKNPGTYTAKVIEPWMDDLDEVSNRATIRLLRGDMAQGIRRIFEKPGQNGAWWLSPDWQTIYVSTDWTNFHLPSGPDGYGQSWHTLWKSTDGGQNWQQLPWPERTQPGQPLFMADGKRGYLVADGMRIWRTRDGGEHWQEIPLPAWTNQQLTGHPSGNGFLPMVKDSRATFSAFDLAEDGTLRVAFYVRQAKLAAGIGEVKESTLIYSLPFTAALETQAGQWMQPDIVLPQQTVMDIKPAPPNGLHLIVQLGQLPHEKEVNTPIRPAAYLYWQNGKETYRHAFAPRIIPGALFVGQQAQLVLAGESRKPEQIMSDNITLISTDHGRTWDETDDGMAYAWYYEAERNRIWKYQLNSLYWRKVE